MEQEKRSMTDAGGTDQSWENLTLHASSLAKSEAVDYRLLPGPDA